jgi:signal transduction histidine kinase
MEAARSAAEAAQATAEESSRRSAFLAQISSELAGLLETEVTVQNLARGVVPFLGDFAAVRVPAEAGGEEATELAWVDSPGPSGVKTASGTEMLPAFLTEAMARVQAAGKMEVQDWDDGNLLCQASRVKSQKPDPGFEKPDNEDNSLPLPLHCMAVLPLRVRQETLGTLTLGMGPSRRRFGPADIELAENLASRAAVFLENARLYQQIIDADRRKNEFLSMLAHELRNPMAPIQNAVEILNSLDAPGDELKWIKGVIDRNVRQLARLVNDLLDISRITQGKIRVEKEPVKVTDIVDQAVEISRPLIDSRKHELALSVSEDPLWVNGDSTRLAQVIANLLNNAAKYTEPGGLIELGVGAEDDQVVFRVRDSGIGIAPDMLPKIFELFTQIDRSLDRALGGLGIGLSLVKSVVELHDGTVQAFSGGLGKGSEFVVHLPRLDPSMLNDRPEEKGVPRPAHIQAPSKESNGMKTKMKALAFKGEKTETAKEDLSEER